MSREELEEQLVYNGGTDVASIDVEEYAGEHLIKVYPYRANFNRNKHKDWAGAITASLVRITQADVDDFQILKLDNNGKRYFEMYYAVDNKTGVTIPSGSENFTKVIKKIKSFQALTNNYFDTFDDKPDFFTVEEPFDAEKYKKGEQVVYYGSNFQPTQDNITTLEEMGYFIDEVTRVAAIDLQDVSTLIEQLEKATIQFTESANGLDNPKVLVDGKVHPGIRVKMNPYALLNGIKARGGIIFEDGYKRDSTDIDFYTVGDVIRDADGKVVRTGGFAPIKMSPDKVTDKVTMYADWYDYLNTTPYFVADFFNKKDGNKIQDLFLGETLSPISTDLQSYGFNKVSKYEKNWTDLGYKLDNYSNLEKEFSFRLSDTNTFNSAINLSTKDIIDFKDYNVNITNDGYYQINNAKNVIEYRGDVNDSNFLYFHDVDKIYKVNKSTGAKEDISVSGLLTGEYIDKIVFDNIGNTYLLVRKTGGVAHYRILLNGQEYFVGEADDTIDDLLLDKNGNSFFSIRDKGIYKNKVKVIDGIGKTYAGIKIDSNNNIYAIEYDNKIVKFDKNTFTKTTAIDGSVNDGYKVLSYDINKDGDIFWTKRTRSSEYYLYKNNTQIKSTKYQAYVLSLQDGGFAYVDGDGFFVNDKKLLIPSSEGINNWKQDTNGNIIISTKDIYNNYKLFIVDKNLNVSEFNITFSHLNGFIPTPYIKNEYGSLVGKWNNSINQDVGYIAINYFKVKNDVNNSKFLFEMSLGGFVSEYNGASLTPNEQTNFLLAYIPRYDVKLAINKEDIKLIEDMIILSAGFKDGWSAIPRDDKNNIKPDIWIGHFGTRIQGIADKKAADVIDGLVLKYEDTHPDFRIDKQRYQMFRSLVNALSKYITSNTYTTNGGLNELNSLTQPWFLLLQQGSKIDYWSHSKEMLVVTPGDDGYPREAMKKSLVLEGVEYSKSTDNTSATLTSLSSLKWKTYSTYFKETFSQNNNYGFDEGINITNKLHLSDTRIVESDRKVVLPELKMSIVENNKINVPGQNNGSDDYMSNMFYIKLNSLADVERLFLNGLETSTKVEAGQKETVVIPNGEIGKTYDWTYARDYIYGIYGKENIEEITEKDITINKDVWVDFDTIEPEVYGTFWDYRVKLMSNKFNNKIISRRTNNEEEWTDGKKLFNMQDEQILKDYIDTFKYETDNIRITNNTLHVNTFLIGSPTSGGNANIQLRQFTFGTVNVTFKTSGTVQLSEPRLISRQTYFDKTEWMKFINSYVRPIKEYVDLYLISENDTIIDFIDEITLLSAWGDEVIISALGTPEFKFDLPSKQDETIGVQRISIF